jgi:hypothetical protein
MIPTGMLELKQHLSLGFLQQLLEVFNESPKRAQTKFQNANLRLANAILKTFRWRPGFDSP